MEFQDTMDIVDIEDTMLLPKYQLLMAGWGIGWNSGVTSCHWQPRGTDVGAAGDMVAHCCYLVGQLTRGMVTSTPITISTNCYSNHHRGQSLNYSCSELDHGTTEGYLELLNHARVHHSQ